MFVLMISWFARFKNRLENLQTNHEKYIEKSDAKIIEQSSTNQSTMEPNTIKKTSKHRCEKKTGK